MKQKTNILAHLSRVLLTLLITVSIGQAQCDKSRWGMPDQSIDNRFLPDGYRYGYPITMFNKSEQDWTLEDAIKMMDT